MSRTEIVYGQEKADAFQFLDGILELGLVWYSTFKHFDHNSPWSQPRICSYFEHFASSAPRVSCSEQAGVHVQEQPLGWAGLFGERARVKNPTCVILPIQVTCRAATLEHRLGRNESAVRVCRSEQCFVPDDSPVCAPP